MGKLKKRTLSVCILFDNEIRDCAMQFTLWRGARGEGESQEEVNEAGHRFISSFIAAFKDLIENPQSAIALASQDSRLHEELMRAVKREQSRERGKEQT